jgi:hypothetical protein
MKQKMSCLKVSCKVSIFYILCAKLPLIKIHSSFSLNFQLSGTRASKGFKVSDNPLRFARGSIYDKSTGTPF